MKLSWETPIKVFLLCASVSIIYLGSDLLKSDSGFTDKIFDYVFIGIGIFVIFLVIMFSIPRYKYTRKIQEFLAS